MEKKKRFFGLHFDFHAGNDVEIGIRTEPADIEWYIKEARPDFIQCDCKGHPGNCSYPTKVGKAADKIVNDNLRIWCDTAKKHEIPIFMHYSGVWDVEYTKAHPEDAAWDKDGNPTGKISLFGRYVHDILIPQFKELIDMYGIDGVWIDGDDWAVERDYSELAKPYLWEGMTEVEHNRVMHDAFLRYVKTYVDALHEYHPGFMVTSNWMYTSYIPEKPTVDIDFISGDYPHNNSVHAARYEGRCIAAQNMPWDLMAWGFEWTHFADKPAIQLQQEAAAVLMLGGGFQMYLRQNKDGSAQKNRSGRIREIADFVHARRMLFEKKPIAQVGVLYSADSYYQKSNIFNAAGATNALIGTLNAVLDAQYTANIILEYQLDTLKNYEIVIVPEWEFMSEATKQALADYAKNGGKLVVIGAECTRQLGEVCGQNFGEIKEFMQMYLLDEAGGFAGITDCAFRKRPCRVLDIKTGDDMLYEMADLRNAMLPASRVDAFGTGNIAWIPFDFGTDYFDARTYIHTNFIKKILNKLSAPFVEINRKMIDLSMQEQENGMILNLLNMNQGRHTQEILIYDEIAPIYEVELLIHKAYRKVTMPLGEEFSYETGADTTKICLKRLDIHSILLLEE